MTPAEETQFNNLISNFVIAPYEVVMVRGAKVSSFVSGQQGSAVFFWRAPAGRVYIVNTQAPYLIRLIQQAVGASVDGRFGDNTRIAIVNDARSRGVNFPDNEPVLAPLMAYAINRALFGGVGTVGIPGSVQYPDIALATLASGTSSYLRMRDIATGRDATLAPVTLPTGQVARLPTNANDPPPVANNPVPVAPPTPAPPTPRPELPPTRTEERTLTDADRRVLNIGQQVAPAQPQLARAFVSSTAPENITVRPWTVEAPWRILSQEPSGSSFRALAEGPPMAEGWIRISMDNGSNTTLPLSTVAGQQTNVVVALDASGNATIQSQWRTPIGTDGATAAPTSGTRPESLPGPAPAPGLPPTRPEGLPGNNNALAPGPAPTYPVAPPQQPVAPPQPMSTGAKVAIGVVGVAAVGGLVWYAKSNRWF